MSCDGGFAEIGWNIHKILNGKCTTVVVVSVGWPGTQKVVDGGPKVCAIRKFPSSVPCSLKAFQAGPLRTPSLSLLQKAES